MSKVLVIEDDRIKIEKISSFLDFEDFIIKESYHSGLEELNNNSHLFKYLILDMTIPLWDRGKSDLGGTYEQFGGERILKEMRRRKKFIPTILLSMFDVFPTTGGNLTFKELDNNLKSQFPDFYKGAVFYNGVEEDRWKKELKYLIDSINPSIND